MKTRPDISIRSTVTLAGVWLFAGLAILWAVVFACRPGPFIAPGTPIMAPGPPIIVTTEVAT